MPNSQITPHQSLSRWMDRAKTNHQMQQLIRPYPSHRADRQRSIDISKPRQGGGLSPGFSPLPGGPPLRLLPDIVRIRSALASSVERSCHFPFLLSWMEITLNPSDQSRHPLYFQLMSLLCRLYN